MMACVHTLIHMCNAGMVVPEEQVDLPEGHQSGPVHKDHADGSTGTLHCICNVLLYTMSETLG